MPSPKDGRGRMLEACHREQGVPRERATLLARFKKIKKSKLTCTLIHKVCQRDAQWAWVKAIYTSSYTSSNISLLRRLSGERCSLPPWWHEFTLQDPNDRTELITTVVSWLLCVCVRTCIQDTQTHTLNILKVKIVEKLTRRWQMSQYSGSTEGDALL